MLVAGLLLACTEEAVESHGLRRAAGPGAGASEGAGDTAGEPDADTGDLAEVDTADEKDGESAPTDTGASTTAPARVAGFRASPYGGAPFGDAGYWQDVGEGMAERIADSGPGGVWILGVAGDDGTCYLNFPSPGGSFDDVAFAAEDENEAALDRFDEAGLRVWLQVEPGDADVSDLIALVLDRYGHHPSVVGFGVDVEWFRWRTYTDGKPVSDEKAAEWRAEVQAHDPSYSLFLKHWLVDRMPPTEREGLVFVDDGQGVSSLRELVSYFSEWGEAFAPAPVGFQFGYETDRGWWGDYDDPPEKLGDAIVEAVPNAELLLWVDFTVEEVFPR